MQRPFAQLSQQSRITTFGQAIALVRARHGHTHHNVADFVHVKASRVKDWEQGRAVPNAHEVTLLCKMMASLRFYRELLPRPVLKSLPASPADPSATLERQVLEAPEPAPKTFGEALRRARLAEGLGQAEVAELLNVEQGTVSRWELDRNPPVRDLYRALCEIFPSLKQAPSPDSRDIDKPEGNHLGNGGSPNPVVPPITQPIQIAPHASTPATPAPTPLEELGRAYAQALAAKAEADAAVPRARETLRLAEEAAATALARCNEAHARLLGAAGIESTA